MERALIDDVTLEYADSGAGEPMVLIHGALVADPFGPLLAQRGLADRRRLIVYRRRGYAGSGPAREPAGIARHARDCARLLSHLGVRRAHVVGHSLGGAVGLQLALDSPGLVGTLSLLEPAIIAGESAGRYRGGLLGAIRRFREAGARVAVDEFLRMRWPAYRDHLERALPGALEQAVADAATCCFEADLPSILAWRFGEAEARRIAAPALVVLGGESAALHPRFAEIHRLLVDWLPEAEGLALPGVSHFMQVEDPGATAVALAGFLARHPLGG